jgi:hypothetical protein
VAELVVDVAGVATLGVVQPGWSVGSAATPSDPSAQPPAAPSASLSALNTSKSKYLSGSAATLEHQALGTLPGSFGNLVQPDATSAISFSSIHSLLLAERSAGPVGQQALSVTYAEYVALVSDQITVDYQASSDPVVTYIGWYGSVWQRLHELALVNQQEIYATGNTLVIRDRGSYQLSSVVDLTSILANVQITRNSRGLGRKVKVNYYEPTLVSTLGSVLYNLSENPSVESNATDWGALTGNVSAPTNTGRKTTDGMFGTCHYGAQFNDGPAYVDDVLQGVYGKNWAGYIYNDIDASEFVVGQQYTASAYAKLAATLTSNPDGFSFIGHIGAAGLRAVAVIRWLNGSGAQLQSNMGASIALVDGAAFGAAGRVSVAGTKPAGAATARVMVYFTATATRRIVGGGPAPTDPVGYVVAGMDAAMMNPGVLVDYGDGTVAGWSWLGSANNSISTRPYDNDANAFYDALADDNTIYEVHPGETKKFVITTANYPDQLIQPTPAVAPPVVSIGEYIVSGADGLPISGPQWVDYGGDVIVTIGEEPNLIELTLIGATDIPGVEGPYSLSVSDGDDEYATLSIAGTGVRSSPQFVDILTGVDETQVATEFAPAVDTPFLNTLEDAYDSGIWATARSGGSAITLNASVPTALLTSFGIADGGTFVYDECRYRVLTTTTGRVDTVITAEWYVTQDDFDDAWDGADLDTIQAVWDGYTANQLEIAPLRTE